MVHYTNTIDIPFGVIYYMWDPRTPQLNKFILDNAQYFIDNVWYNLKRSIPQAKCLEEIGGLSLVFAKEPNEAYIPYQKEPGVFGEQTLRRDLMVEGLYSSHSPIPLFVFRAPHFHQMYVALGDSKTPEIGNTGIIYSNVFYEIIFKDSDTYSHLESVAKDLSYISDTLSNFIIHQFSVVNGSEVIDYLNMPSSCNNSKEKAIELMYEGEVMLRKFENRKIDDKHYFNLLLSFDGIGLVDETIDETTLPYSSAICLKYDLHNGEYNYMENGLKGLKDYSYKYADNDKRMEFMSPESLLENEFIRGKCVEILEAEEKYTNLIADRGIAIFESVDEIEYFTSLIKQRDMMRITSDHFAQKGLNIDYYINKHEYKDINFELYSIIRRYTDSPLVIMQIFDESYSLATMTFLDAHPENNISYILKNYDKNDAYVYLSVTYGLLSIRKNNTKVVNLYLELLETELSKYKNGKWDGFYEKIKLWSKEQEIMTLNFKPVPNPFILPSQNDIDDFCLFGIPADKVSVKLCEHIIRCMPTVCQQMEIYNYIEQEINKICSNNKCPELVRLKTYEHFEIASIVLSDSDNIEGICTMVKLPFGWEDAIRDGKFGNYLTLGAIDGINVDNVPATEDEYEKIMASFLEGRYKENRQECENMEDDLVKIEQKFDINNLSQDIKAKILKQDKIIYVAECVNGPIKDYIYKTGNKGNWDAVNLAFKFLGFIPKKLSREKVANILVSMCPGLGEAQKLKQSMEQAQICDNKKINDYNKLPETNPTKRITDPVLQMLKNIL